MDLMVLSTGFCTPAMAETWWRQVERDEWVGGSPGGHSNECFSKNFLPLLAQLMSCWSSSINVPPVHLVLVLVVGLFAAVKLGDDLELSDWFLSLLLFAGGMVIFLYMREGLWTR